MAGNIFGAIASKRCDGLWTLCRPERILGSILEATRFDAHRRHVAIVVIVAFPAQIRVQAIRLKIHASQIVLLLQQTASRRHIVPNVREAIVQICVTERFIQRARIRFAHIVVSARSAHRAPLECNFGVTVVALARFAFLLFVATHFPLVDGHIGETASFHQLVLVFEAIAAQRSYGQQTLRAHCERYIRATVCIDQRIAGHAKFTVDDVCVAVATIASLAEVGRLILGAIVSDHLAYVLRQASAHYNIVSHVSVAHVGVVSARGDWAARCADATDRIG